MSPGFSNKGLFGTGAYFAVNASYSANSRYSFQTKTPGHCVFILARVLVGDAFEMKPFGKLSAFPNKPPRRPFSDEPSPQQYNAAPEPKLEPEPAPADATIDVDGARFDSITGTTNGSKVFIVHGNGRAYPMYYVIFK